MLERRDPTRLGAAGVRLSPSLGRFIWEVSGPHQLALSALSVLVFLLSTAPLEVQRRMVNDAFKGGQFQPILALALAYVGLAIAEGAVKLAMNVYRGWVSETTVRSLRRTVHLLLREASSDRVAADALGIETSMMLAEAEPIGGFVGVSVSEPMMQGGLLLAVFGYMTYLEPLMALVALLVFCPQIVFVPLMQHAINLRVARRISALREVSVAMMGEPGAHFHVGQDLDVRIDDVFALNMGIYKLKFSMNFLMNLLHHSGTAGVLAAGGWFVVHGQTEVGTVVAFVSGLAKINDPWGDLVNWFRDLTATATKYDLIAQAVNAIAEETETPLGTPVDVVE